MRRDLLPQQRWLNAQPRAVRLFALIAIFGWQPAALFVVWRLIYPSMDALRAMSAAAELVAVGLGSWSYIMLRYTEGVCMLAAKRARANKQVARALRIIGGAILIALLGACVLWLYSLMADY